MYGGIGMNANENERTLTCQFRNTAKDFTFLAKIKSFIRYKLHFISLIRILQ